MASETLPITSDSIIAQVTALGGTVTSEVRTLAGTIAAKLAEQGVQMKRDGKMVDACVLVDAGVATDGLQSLRLAMTTFMLDSAARRDDPELAGTRQTATATYNAAIAVQAAVSTLLGDSDDPTIGHYQSTLRRAALVGTYDTSAVA